MFIAETVHKKSLGFGERFALGIVRGALNVAIGKFTPYELCRAIEEDRNLWGLTPDRMRIRIQGYKNRFKKHFEKFSSQLNTPLMVEWLEKDQPLLYGVIMASTNNYAWFDRQVKRYLEEIQSM